MAATVVGTPLDSTTAGQLAFDMASTAPPAGKTVLVFVTSRRGTISSAPTLAGTNGWNVTWTSLGTVETGGSNLSRLTVFRGIPSSSTAGVLTATHSTTHVQCQITALAIDSVDQTTNQGVVGTPDTNGGTTGGALTLTFSPTVTAGNLAVMAGVSRDAGTPPTSFTPDTSPVPDGSSSLCTGGINGFGVQWIVSPVTDLQGTLVSGVNWGAMGIEIAISAAVHSTLTATAGSYAITGTSTPLLLVRRLTPTAGSYAIVGTPVALIRGRRLTAQAGAYSIAGTPASLLIWRRLGASGGTYSVSGTSATLTYTPAGAAFVLTAQPGAYAITGTQVVLRAQRKIGVLPGVYAITGTAATLIYTSAGVRLTALPGSYAIAGTAVALRRAARVYATAGTYTIVGSPVTFATVPLGQDFDEVLWSHFAMRQPWSGALAMRQPAGETATMRQPRDGILTMRQPSAGSVALLEED